MPVKFANDPQCGVCLRYKAESNRWFLSRAEGKVFTFRDYDPTYVSQYDDASCSMTCLNKLIQRHADSLMRIRDGRESQRSVAATTAKVGK
jgi:hypothetical protein